MRINMVKGRCNNTQKRTTATQHTNNEKPFHKGFVRLLDYFKLSKAAL